MRLQVSQQIFLLFYYIKKMAQNIQNEIKTLYSKLSLLKDCYKSKCEQLKIINLKNSINQDTLQDFVVNIRSFFKQAKKTLSQVSDQLSLLETLYNSQKSQLPIDLKKLFKSFQQKKTHFQEQIEAMRKVINVKQNKAQEMKKVSNKTQQVVQKELANYVKMANSVSKMIDLVQKKEPILKVKKDQDQQYLSLSINVSKISKKSNTSMSNISLNDLGMSNKKNQDTSVLSYQSLSPDLYCPKKHKLKKMIDFKRQTFTCDMCQKDYQIKFSSHECKACKYYLCLICSAKMYKSLGQDLHLQKNSFDSGSRLLQSFQQSQGRFTRQKLQMEQLSALKKYKKQPKQFVQSEIKFQKRESIRGNLREVSSVITSKYKQKVQEQKQQKSQRKRCPACKKFMKKQLKICEKCADEDF